MQWGSNELLTSVSRGKLFLFEIIINYYSKIHFSCRVCSDFHCSCTRQQCLKPPEKTKSFIVFCSAIKSSLDSFPEWAREGSKVTVDLIFSVHRQLARAGRHPSCPTGQRRGGRTGEERRHNALLAPKRIADLWPLSTEPRRKVVKRNLDSWQMKRGERSLIRERWKDLRNLPPGVSVLELHEQTLRPSVLPGLSLRRSRPDQIRKIGSIRPSTSNS